ncbi:MAG: helix-turn-helix domain-containing protein [Oscillospiraceae bacterium]|nr:helix-turn-helix domain-containing protein [Oscillospiraceae bacterium]
MKEKKPINIEVGQYVKQCREEAGLTQEAFAELIGLGVKHVSAIECGAVGVSLSTLRRMSKALSVPADLLLFGTADEIERQGRFSELQVLFSRLSRLPPNKFRVVKDIMDKLLEALAME